MEEKKVSLDEERILNTKGSIYIFGTFDTKGAEIEYLSLLISNKLCKWSEPSLSNTGIKLIDISSSKCITYSDEFNENDCPFYVDYTCRDIVKDWDVISKLDRNESIAAVTQATHKFIESQYKKGLIFGVISVGGSCGTSMASSLFTKNLPIGLPKIIISTMAASTYASKFISCSDLILMPSIVDICGVSDIYKIIAENAACAMVGMAMNYALNKMESVYHKNKSNKFTIGITMFGITTQCVEFVKSKLYSKYGMENIDILVFHATGSGGKCMEYLINNGLINGVIDITTTEVADYICGGILCCDEYRFDAAKNNVIPSIISLGAVNTVNFGAKASVSADLLKDKQHVLHVHNASITLMKANENELENIAKFIANKINGYKADSVALMIPTVGISALDSKESQSTFASFVVNDVNILKATFEKEIQNKNDIIKYVNAHINEEKFAESVVNEFENILNKMNIEINVKINKKKVVEKREKGMVLDRFAMEGKRKEIIALFYDKISKGEAIIGAGAGTGISAKCEVLGGADLIIIYNSGKYRMAGRGSLAGLLPFGDANKIVQEMANQVIPIVKQLRGGIVPVLAGINGTDPFKDMDLLLNKIKNLGFDGVQNFPTVGLIDGKFRSNLEETGFGYDKEVLCMKIAKNKYNLITTPYVFDVCDCVKMAQIGVDIIVIHLGLTVGGTIGSKTTGMTLNDACKKILIMANAIYCVNPNQIILAHGGPVATPSDVKYVLNKLPKGTIDGFYGASSMERLPVEIAITDTIKQFKDLKL